MKCPRCHKENSDGANYCSGCGFPLAAVSHDMRFEENGNMMPKRNVKRANRGFLSNFTKAVLYVVMFFVIQNAVSSFFAVSVLLRDASLYTMQTTDELYLKLYDILDSHLIELSLVSGLISLLFVSLFFTVRKKNILDEAWMNVEHLSLKSVLLCAVLGTALYLFCAVTISILPIPEALLFDLEYQYSGLFFESNVILELFTTAVVTAIVEETFFRGLAYTRLKRSYPKAAAVVISALIFGVSHGIILAMMYAFVVGVIICLVDETYKTIVAGMIVHCFFNMGGYWVVYIDDNDFVVLALYCLSIGLLIGGLYLALGTKFGYRESAKVKADDNHYLDDSDDNDDENDY